MSRRTAPDPIARVIDGVRHFGADAWAECSWCGSKRDLREYPSCPPCDAAAADAERRHLDGIRQWGRERRALEARTNGSIH